MEEEKRGEEEGGGSIWKKVKMLILGSTREECDVRKEISFNSILFLFRNNFGVDDS